ncbi:MAG TPA: hypothetical protein VL981_11310 [Candidatus Methylacidiphilales bacterium]|nr:hypothetical protein [Candidatus Methylacidiphilales bacterium]
MSNQDPPYSQTYITAWTILSLVLGVVLLSMFILGSHYLVAGHMVWDLIRYLASPII